MASVISTATLIQILTLTSDASAGTVIHDPVTPGNVKFIESEDPLLESRVRMRAQSRRNSDHEEITYLPKPGVPNIDIVPPVGLERHAKQHELWLAMQNAHDRYRTASSALERDSAYEQYESDEHSSDESAVREQRTAFEQYVEARLEFTEFMVDQRTAEPQALARLNEAPPGPTGYLRTGRQGLTLLAGALIVTCATICSVAYLMHERRIVRDFDQQSRQMDTLLDLTNRDIGILNQKLDVLRSRSELAKQIVQRSRRAGPRNSGVHRAAPSNGRRHIVSAQRRGGRIGPFRSQLKRQPGFRLEPLPEDITASLRNTKHAATS